MALRGAPEVLFSLHLPAFPSWLQGKGVRNLGSLLKALGKAMRQQLWQREILTGWGECRRRVSLGGRGGELGGGCDWCVGAVVVYAWI